VTINPPKYRGPFQPGDIISYNFISDTGLDFDSHLFFVIKYAGTVPAESSHMKIPLHTYTVINLGGDLKNLYIGPAAPRGAGARGMITVPESRDKRIQSGTWSLVQRIE